MTPEAAVLAAWREVLGVADATPADRFIESGGDSLKAIQLASRLTESLGFEVPLLAVFDHPTPGDLAAALAAGAGTPAAPPQDVEGGEPGEPPLSYPQSRLWFLSELEPGSAAYNAPAAWTLRGRLDGEALARAVARLFQRHEALRTGFVRVGDEAVQRVSPTGPELELLVPAEGGRDAALRTAVARAGAPVSPAAGQPGRAWLVRAAGDEHLLVLALHHAVCDGPSRALLGRDLARLYEAERGSGPEPEPPAARYADFAVRQRRQAAGGALAADLEFWRRELAGASDDLPVRPDRARPARAGRRGGRRAVAFRPGLVRALRTLGATRGVTPFMALLASFAAVLGRWSGERDLSIGTPVLGRPPEFAGVVGHFANTVVLRLRLAGDPTFGELLDHVRAVTLRTYEHQELPFERLVQELRPERDLGRNPLFQVMLALQPAPPALEAAGLCLEPLDLDLGTAKLDLMAWLETGEHGIVGYLEYSADLFAAATIDRLAWQWERLLDAGVANPDVRVDDVDLVPEPDRRRLAAWSASGPEPRGDAVHRRFEAQAARVPDAPAIVTARGVVSYRELDGWAERIAGRLRDAGAGPETAVAVCLRRGPGLVAALLGVLKAGAAYLPLDPEYPPERLRLMLESARAAVAIAEPALAPHVRAGRRVLLADAFQPPASGAGAAPLDCRSWPGSLAYLISTSGSTGRPKSVAIEHRGVAALVDWALDVFGPDELGGVLASTSVCFDLFAFELFAPLAAGGTVLLCDTVLDLPSVPWRDRVRLVNTVPSAARALLALGPLPASVRTVNLAGEALPGSLVADLYREPGVERVLNLYGPSEDTTYSTWEVVPRDSGTPAIGRPLAGKRTYVLDGRLRPVAPGMTGQVFVAGPGVARGYAGAGALTAASFLPDPQRSDGSRMYATGDAGRWLPDGRLEFLGRMDAQLKVRGIRVDPGEIESALLTVPGVREAAAVAVGEGPERGLVGCVVCAAERADVLPALRGALAERLPAALVPGAFLAFERLPRTPSGKVDRRRLAELAAARQAAQVAAEARDDEAAGPLERAVSEVWRGVLGVPAVPARRSFFELGGHSLLATRLVSRMRERFGVDIGLAAVFERPTVVEMARLVEQRLGAEVAIPPRRHRGPARLSFGQQRLYFLESLGLGAPCYNLGALVRIDGPLDAGALARSVEAVARRHDVLRTTLLPGGPEGELVQVVDPDVRLECPLVDLCAAAEPEAEARRLAVGQARARFDLATGPLLRCSLLRLGPEAHRLALAVHHAVFDGWSAGVFLGDLVAAYERGPDGLAALPLQFADYAEWQRSERSAGRMTAALAAWRRLLAGAPEALGLPADRPRPPHPGSRGGRVPFHPGADVSERVREVARRTGATPFMVLLAAYGAVLGERSGQGRVVVGCPVANRGEAGLTGMIGFFVNTLALPLDLRGRPTFLELVERTRRTCLDAYAHQELPFEQLVEALGPPREAGRNPVFQAAFAMQNAAPPRTFGGGLRWGFEWLDLGTAKFDLLLDVTDDGVLGGHLEYSADLFEARSAAALADRLLHVLDAATARPEQMTLSGWCVT